MFAAAGYAGIQLIAMLTAVGSCAFVLRIKRCLRAVDEEKCLDEKLACYAHAARMQITDWSSRPLTKQEREAL
ncbi:hypothetical protein K525DRAFT_201383 [Schizophyllum commune Loenen D]|nr:hypothetical protein K525DRAFT_201383 [Schizophyllum commune Loenen D]